MKLALTLALIALLGSACGAATPPARFYILSTIAEAPPPQSRPVPALLIGLGPSSLPEYLRRPQIVRRQSENTLELLEFDRWAELLEHNFQQTLRQNLAQLCAAGSVVSFPWPRRTELSHQLLYQVERFDCAAAQCVLELTWELQDFRNPAADGTAGATRTKLQETAAGEQPAALVAAQSALLADFARQVAQLICSASAEP